MFFWFDYSYRFDLFWNPLNLDQTNMIGILFFCWFHRESLISAAVLRLAIELASAWSVHRVFYPTFEYFVDILNFAHCLNRTFTKSKRNFCRELFRKRPMQISLNCKTCFIALLNFIFWRLQRRIWAGNGSKIIELNRYFINIFKYFFSFKLC